MISMSFEEIEKIVRDMFDQADRNFCGFEWYFDVHIRNVVEWSKKLAEKYGGDEEVVVLVAYLHDIGLIEHGITDQEKKNL